MCTYLSLPKLLNSRLLTLLVNGVVVRAGSGLASLDAGDEPTTGVTVGMMLVFVLSDAAWCTSAGALRAVFVGFCWAEMHCTATASAIATNANVFFARFSIFFSNAINI